MAPRFVKIIPAAAHSYVYKVDRMQNPTGWHSHPEIELLWVVSGSGTRFVGDSIEPFQEQELVLLGENLPHSWQAENLTDERPEAVVIQFQRTFLGNEFFQTPEFAHIDRLLDRADRGLLFSGETLSPVTALLTQLPTQSALEQVFTILRVLDRLSTIDAYRTLARPSFSADYHRSTDGRIDRVYEFTIAQFGQNITLRQAAEVAGLTEASFCRYFKLHTRRTYVEFLNEIRVGYACKLLITTNRDITQICYECGFLTLSNFNRRFKRVTGLTPTHYRERISQNQG